MSILLFLYLQILVKAIPASSKETHAQNPLSTITGKIMRAEFAVADDKLPDGGLLISGETIQMDSVSLNFASNSNGDKFVIGLPYNNETKVYKLVSDETCETDQLGCQSWVQFGNAIQGSENFGLHVTMNDMGNRVAVGTFNEDDIGAVRVYQINSSDCGINGDGCWEQIGDKITSGSKVAMDSSGLQLSILDGDSGTTRIYGQSTDCTDGQSLCWMQIAQDIPGLPNPYEVYGNILALGKDGTTVAIGNPGPGEVSIYGYQQCSTGTFCWAAIGEKITGSQFAGRFGSAVAFNEASDRIIIGAPFHDVDELVNAGMAEIYELVADNCSSGAGQCWKQVGQTITGGLPYDKLGYSVALNRNGDVAAIGSPYADNGDIKNVGKLQIFELTDADSSWKLKAEKLYDMFDVDEDTKESYFLGLNEIGDTIVTSGLGYPGRVTRFRLYPCKDSPRRFILNGKSRKCSWVRQIEDNITKRCSKKGVSSHCPVSCGECNTYACNDSEKKFTLWNGNTKSCKWVRRVPSKVDIRCGKAGVTETCRETCEFCLNV